MAVVADGRPSVTGYRVRERWRSGPAELDLVTGRTHQIRVHLDAIGHPLAGDPIYGNGTSRRGPEGLRRLFLHSWRIALHSPSSGLPMRPRRPAGGAAGVLESLRGGDGSIGSAGPALTSPRWATGASWRCPARRTDGRSMSPASRLRASTASHPMLVIISGPSGWARTRSSPPSRSEAPAALPLCRDLHDAAPRPGEIEGTSYHFVSPEGSRRCDAGELLSHLVTATGTALPRRRAPGLARGQHAILKIDVQGARVVKERVPAAVLIFVVPPSIETLDSTCRPGGPRPEELEVRQRNAALELAGRATTTTLW